MSKTAQDKVRGEWKIPFTDFVLKMEDRAMTEDGAEIPDPVPLEPPVGFVRRPSLADQIRDMVRSERLAQEALAMGAETFADADDFDIPDDPLEPGTPYEAEFEPLSVVQERARAAAQDAQDGPSRPERPQAPAEQPAPPAPVPAASAAPPKPSGS